MNIYHTYGKWTIMQFRGHMSGRPTFQLDDLNTGAFGRVYEHYNSLEAAQAAADWYDFQDADSGVR